MKRPSPWFALLPLVAVSMVGCVNRDAQKEGKQTETIVNDPIKEVTAKPVQVTMIQQTLEITGQITASQDAELGAKQGGRIASVLVGDGDQVHAGQLLASIDTSTLNAQVSQALANLASARSQLAQAQANAAIGPERSQSAVTAAKAALDSAKASLAKAKAGARPEERAQADAQVRASKSDMENAKAEMARQQLLFSEGAGTKQQAEHAQTAYQDALSQYNAAVQAQLIDTNGTRPEDMAVAEENVKSAQEQVNQALDQQKLDVLLTEQVEAAQASVQSAQDQVTIAQQAVADAQIVAPFDGRVSGKPIQVGTIILPGTPVIRLVGKGSTYFEGEVPEDSVTFLQPGMPVTVTVDALGGRQISAHLEAIDPVGADFGRNYKVRITLDGAPPEVLPGMFARGTLAIKQVPNAIVIPAEAILTRDNQKVVFVVDGNKAKLVNVTPGIQQQDLVQVTGLTAGQQVITEGQSDLVDGVKIKVEPQVAGTPAPAKEG